MVALQIGALALSVATARPADLEEQLVAATGCGSRELLMILGAGPDRAAHALLPFVAGERPAIGELAREIAADPLGLAKIAAHYVLTLVPDEGADHAEEVRVDE